MPYQVDTKLIPSHQVDAKLILSCGCGGGSCSFSSGSGGNSGSDNSSGGSGCGKNVCSKSASSIVEPFSKTSPTYWPPSATVCSISRIYYYLYQLISVNEYN
jgi:hypothetical protein